jgi:hypothetical protein
MTGAFFLPFVLEIPDADGDAKDGEEQFAERLDAVLVVGLPDGIPGDADAGQHKIPPLPFLSVFAGF